MTPLTGPLLAIESSCDETAIAILSPSGEVLADIIHSQVKDHAPYGGIVPEVASRQHILRIQDLVQRALDTAAIGPTDIAAVCATRGPGLIGALLVGLQFAKGYAHALGVPFLGVHHLEGHLMAASLDEGAPTAPFIGLVASGGHSALYRFEGPGDITLLGETRDDAAGEAFDKCAKLLGLGYPGGAVVDAHAQRGDRERFAFPVSLKDRRTYDYSFSGLKTSFRLRVEKLQSEGHRVEGQLLDDLCASLTWAIVDALLRKAILACRKTQVKRLVLGGGVAANSLLRSEAIRRAKNNDIECFVPPRRLCTDNAVMIGAVGLAHYRLGAQDPLTIGPNPSLPLGAVAKTA